MGERRDRKFLEQFEFASNDYASIVQTNYPGAHDQGYRARVNSLIKQSEDAWPQIPTRYEYNEKENTTWEMVSKVLEEEVFVQCMMLSKVAHFVCM